MKNAEGMSCEQLIEQIKKEKQQKAYLIEMNIRMKKDLKNLAEKYNADTGMLQHNLEAMAAKGAEDMKEYKNNVKLIKRLYEELKQASKEINQYKCLLAKQGKATKATGTN